MILTETSTRQDLAKAMGTLGFMRGVEVGVEQGLYSEVLCQSIPNLTLICVDAWKAYPGYREHVTQSKLDGFYEITKARLEPYHCSLWRMFSVQAASLIPDSSLDFVYLDANHTYEEISADLEAWAPKVRDGGIVAGHDYCRRKNMDFGVKEAVQEYVAEHGIDTLQILRGDKSPTWMWMKV